MTTNPALAALPMGSAAVAASGRRSSGRNSCGAASIWRSSSIGSAKCRTYASCIMCRPPYNLLQLRAIPLHTVLSVWRS